MSESTKPLIFEQLFEIQVPTDTNIRVYLDQVNDATNLKRLKSYSEKLSLIQSLEWINTRKNCDTKSLLNGRLTVIDFWTYCCINCMHLVPLLHQLEAEFDQLVIVGVHSSKFQNEKSKSNISSAIKRHLIKHPVVLDFDLELWNSLEITCWPTLLVLDPNQVVIAEFKGEIQANLVKQFVKVAFEYYNNQLKSCNF